MACARLLGSERRKFRFPITQYIWLDSGQTAYFSNSEVKLIRNLLRDIFLCRVSHFHGYFTLLPSAGGALRLR